MNDPIEVAAAALDRADYVTALTGAGVSVDSGIPHFRSAGGIWTKYDPTEYATIEAFRRNPTKVWGMLRELGEMVGDAQPNAGHRGLVELERLGCLHAIVTQNVDGLHQAAGSQVVYEFHGNGRRLVCLDCRAAYTREEAQAQETFPPQCTCGAVLKPDVVMFGEMIPDEALAHSYEAARRCQAMLVVGTSAEVYPAAQLPVIAKQHGATIIEINPERTGLTGTLTDIFIRQGASDAVPALAAAARALRGN